MKRGRLRAECLIGLGVPGKQRRHRCRHLVGARGQHLVVGASAAALAALNVEPICAKLFAAAATISGVANTYDIAVLPQGLR